MTWSADVRYLIDASKELSLARDLPTVMAIVRTAARQLLGADGATFVLLERDETGDYCYYADEDAISPLWKGSRFPVDSCISGWAMTHRRAAVIEDIYKDPRIPIDAYSKTFVKSLAMVPIRQEKPLGAIGAYWQEQRLPSFDQVELLSALADITASAIELIGFHTELEKRVRMRTAEVIAKTQELNANIRYASQIQNALLPTPEQMQELLPEHFVIYRPKDIVSGDFYWVRSRGAYVLAAVADCTGHGVTGALLSCMCSAYLDRAVNEFGMHDPGMILEIARQLVYERLSGTSALSDGMDISLCSIDRTSQRLGWSGANRDLWLCRHGELNRLRGHRESISRTDSRSPFPTHWVDLNRGDMIYMMTDGYVDQFGGPAEKKMRSDRLAITLSSIHELNMTEQKQVLEETFDKWKGQHEQVDDVTVLGLRI